MEQRTIEQIIREDILPAIKKTSPREKIQTWVTLISSGITILVVIFALFRPFTEMQRDNRDFKQITNERLNTVEKILWKKYPEERDWLKNPYSSNTRGGSIGQPGILNGNGLTNISN